MVEIINHMCIYIIMDTINFVYVEVVEQLIQDS